MCLSPGPLGVSALAMVAGPLDLIPGCLDAWWERHMLAPSAQIPPIAFRGSLTLQEFDLCLVHQDTAEGCAQGLWPLAGRPAREADVVSAAPGGTKSGNQQRVIYSVPLAPHLNRCQRVANTVGGRH